LRIIYPSYFRIFVRKPEGWAVDGIRTFYNPKAIDYDPDSIWKQYNVTPQKIVIQLFRQYGGKLGYYLVNLRDKKYYYCGLTDEDIQETLYSLGIGRKENAQS
jgi:hypothetical protein